MKHQLLFSLIAALCLAGCNYELQNKSQPANDSGNAKSQINQTIANDAKTETNMSSSNTANTETGDSGEGKLVLSDTGKVAVLPCNNREIEITEDATANTYTFTGECKKLTVNGVSNKIRVDRVGEISAAGISNKIVYGEGLNGGKPRIQKSGKDTTVESVKEQEKKNAAGNKPAA